MRKVAVDAGGSARDERSTCRVDINEALEFALQLAGHELRARATTLTSFGSPPLVDGSKSRLSQAFVSLLLQTARLVPPGRSRETVVRVSTRRHHLGSAAVDVDVSGSRLCWAEFPDPSDVNAGRIADSLGLAICHRTVQELGGRLMVSCEPGAGAWFRVRLPASAS